MINCKHKKLLGIDSGIVLCGIIKKIKFGDHVLWFPKGHKTNLGKFTKSGLVSIRYNST
jgi:hypothetical protein